MPGHRQQHFDATPDWTVATTWDIPADPGIKPANDTGASTPPTATFTAFTAALFSGDAEPAGTGGDTCPRLAQEMTIRSPA